MGSLSDPCGRVTGAAAVYQGGQVDNVIALADRRSRAEGTLKSAVAYMGGEEGHPLVRAAPLAYHQLGRCDTATPAAQQTAAEAQSDMATPQRLLTSQRRDVAITGAAQGEVQGDYDIYCYRQRNNLHSKISDIITILIAPATYGHRQLNTEGLVRSLLPSNSTGPMNVRALEFEHRLVLDPGTRCLSCRLMPEAGKDCSTFAVIGASRPVNEVARLQAVPAMSLLVDLAAAEARSGVITIRLRLPLLPLIQLSTTAIAALLYERAAVYLSFGLCLRLASALANQRFRDALALRILISLCSPYSRTVSTGYSDVDEADDVNVNIIIIISLPRARVL
ncbi:hypothetical protein MRB53_041944 [Persea americana]|nr:hypothetical protein MRB53_041944 [Persea americana]